MDKGIRTIAAVLGIAAGGFWWLTAPASAAPALGANAGGVKAAVSETSTVEQVRWYRRCWRDRRGFRHCRRWWGPGYGYWPYRHRYRYYRGHRW